VVKWIKGRRFARALSVDLRCWLPFCRYLRIEEVITVPSGIEPAPKRGVFNFIRLRFQKERSQIMNGKTKKTAIN
jgi:hypothetical protein